MVYNVTEFLEYHPGGVDIIMDYAGKDATQIYNHVKNKRNIKYTLQYHSFVNYKSMLKNCLLGPVINETKGILMTLSLF